MNSTNIATSSNHDDDDDDRHRHHSLSDIARKAIQTYPTSHVEMAMYFCQEAGCPEFVAMSNDRLLKVGRSIESLVSLLENDNNKSKNTNNTSTASSTSTSTSTTTTNKNKLETSLQLQFEECQILARHHCTSSSSTTQQQQQQPIKVPKVPFGETGIMMPIVTLGCMRFQMEWGPRITTMNQVGTDCQDNLVNILRQAFQYGINHIETARGYGSSELQIGIALQQLYSTKEIQRQDIILQTKITPSKDTNEFRKALETSMKLLQTDYIDLLAVHGMNFPEQIQWLFGNEKEKKGMDEENVEEDTTVDTDKGPSSTDNNQPPGRRYIDQNCWSIIEEYKKAGKIRHVGFSTHASTEMICQLIERNVFEYVNLHYHYFGSYTASGMGIDGRGTYDAIQLLSQKKMGIFIISPFDKGGKLYLPNNKLRLLTLPEMEPITFASWWTWNHHQLVQTSQNDSHNDQSSKKPLLQLHTYTIGAGRPSDLDQSAVAAYLHGQNNPKIVEQVRTVTQRLDEEKLAILGQDWLDNWWKGLIKSDQSKYLVEHNQMIWIYNNIKAFGMYEFGKGRFNAFEKNAAKWDDTKSIEDNISQNIGRNSWGFVPGLPWKPNIDYSDDLIHVSNEYKQRILDAEAFVYNWCHDRTKQSTTTTTTNGTSNTTDSIQVIWNQRLNVFRRNFSVSSQMFQLPSFTITATPTDNNPKEEEEKKKGNESIMDKEAIKTNQDENNIKEDQDNYCIIPWEWQTSYNMSPWPDFPDRPSRGL